MVRKRKIIVYIATSADGFIARSDGSVDWLDRPRPKGNYGMGAFYTSPARSSQTAWSRCIMPSVGNFTSGSCVQVWIPEGKGIWGFVDGAGTFTKANHL
jgi:hypothetical protein